MANVSEHISKERDRATRLISRIRIRHGGITPKDRENTPEDVLESITNLRSQVGASATILATDLSSTKTRFVYELIQNAEDNEYSQARRDGQQPFLSFTLYNDRLVIDSNEDGFTEENVNAICSIGQSTKTNISDSNRYIGEKGIGFKAVFNVAKKVNIQSGHFAFYFEYSGDPDDGLGMVTPFEGTFKRLPNGVRTRMTLSLIQRINFSQRMGDFVDLMNIPDTFLLFLDKIKKLIINIRLSEGSHRIITHTHEPGTNGSRSRILKTEQIGRESRDEARYYHVFSRPVQNLPNDKARKNNDATVVLAFPVDDDDVPIVEDQFVYAFLPIRKVGLPFLIQSDFIMHASREDVVNSDRNTELLSHVAIAFKVAVEQFCQHPTLLYQWMRWLPQDPISDEFWKRLEPQVLSALESARVLRTRSESLLHLPCDVRVVPRDFVDEHGEALCEDVRPELYLSKQYTTDDVSILMEQLGVEVLCIDEAVERVQADLTRQSSRIKTSSNEDWHSKLASLLTTFIDPEEGGEPYEPIRSIEIIPLQDGNWVSSKSEPIFFQQSGPVMIPTDLGLRLIDPAALANSSRKDLYRALGALLPSVRNITSLISQRYQRKAAVSLEESVSHLAYLFWYAVGEHASIDSNIWVYGASERQVARSGPLMKNIYFKNTTDPYGPNELFETHDGHSFPASSDPVPSFINPSYISRFDQDTRVNGKSWISWLRDCVGVKSSLQLLSASNSERLSDEFNWVLEHRSEMLPGLLHNNWSEYEEQITPAISKILKSTRVPIRNGGDLELATTFLPVPLLEREVQYFRIEDFPFLRLPVHLTEENKSSWEFLNILGVTTAIELRFYLRVLDYIDASDRTLLTTLYSRLGEQCTNHELAKLTRTHFVNNASIYIPSGGNDGGIWVTLNECVWSAPDWFDLKYRLEDVYCPLKDFFQLTLHLPDANWRDFLDQLQKMKLGGNCAIAVVTDLYGRLWKEFRNDTDSEFLKRQFESLALVYVPSSETWLPPSACLWIDEKIRISGKASISKVYVSLEAFFTQSLEVSRPEISTYVKELQSAAGRVDHVDEIRNLMRYISSMAPKTSSVQSLRKSSIFPVRLPDGTLQLSNAEADFAIADRQEHYDAFSSEVIMLAFSLHEIRDCGDFLQAMDLGKRYTSKAVEEQSSESGSRLDQTLTDFFRQRAYALYCCGYHYNSPRCLEDERATYTLLLNANIYMSDGITKSIALRQYNKDYIVEGKKSNLHFKESDGELHIYVPRRKHDRQLCFARQLPNHLLRYLIIKDGRAEAVVVNILQHRSLTVVDEILHDAGIVELDGISRPADYESDEQSEAESTVLTPVASLSSSRTRIEGTATPVSRVRSPIPQPPESLRLGVPSRATSPVTPPLRTVVLVPSAYVTILDRMIKFSRMPLVFPRCDEIVTGDPQETEPWYDSLGSDAGFNLRSLERDKRVGAAGELLVFELLSTCELPGFDYSVWKSKIRSFVNIHPDHADLTSWTGRETTDLVYPDKQSALTDMLIENEYLEEDVWRNAKPTYYIEVKTTTKNWDEPFYMSDSQYDRMQSYRLKEDQTSDNVYLLVRVFGIASEKVGLRIYLDPEAARVNGELQFSIETWKVEVAD